MDGGLCFHMSREKSESLINRPAAEGFFFKSRVQGRLFYTLLTIGLLPLLVTASIGYLFARKTVAKEEGAQLRAIVEMKARLLDAWFRERAQDIADIADSEHVRACPGLDHQAQQNRTCSLLDRFQKRSSSFIQLALIDENARSHAATGPLPIGVNRNHIVALIAELQRSSERMIIRTLREPAFGAVVAIARKADADKPNERLFVVGLLNLNEIARDIIDDQTGLGASGLTYLVDEHGLPLDSDPPAADGDKSFSFELETYREQRLQIVAGLAGPQVLRYGMRIKDLGWNLIAERNIDEVFRPIRYIRTVVLGTTLLLILAVAFLSAWVARYFTKPLRAATKAADAVAAGNLTAKINYQSIGEPQHLIDAFNKMVDNVRSTQDELSEKRNELQQAYDKLVAAQDRLLQQERMAAIGQFTASVIHEMRNPLSSIMMNLQIMARLTDDRERLAKHYQLAVAAVNRLKVMFNDLLNFAKPIDITPQPTALRPMIEAAISELHNQLQNQGIAVELAIELGDDCVLLDAERFRQVLLNLLNNAVEAMPNGGTILIRSRFADGLLSIEVIDDGPGMTPEVSARLFEPFFTTKENGVGLGLLVVKKIVEAHGGRLALHSEPGQGTCVRITL